MTEQQRVVIPERISKYPEADVWIYHLPLGKWDEKAEFQEVKCGGGIIFPYREKVGRSQVCPDDCMAGRVTL